MQETVAADIKTPIDLFSIEDIKRPTAFIRWTTHLRCVNGLCIHVYKSNSRQFGRTIYCRVRSLSRCQRTIVPYRRQSTLIDSCRRCPDKQHITYINVYSAGLTFAGRRGYKPIPTFEWRQVLRYSLPFPGSVR